MIEYIVSYVVLFIAIGVLGLIFVNIDLFEVYLMKKRVLWLLVGVGITFLFLELLRWIILIYFNSYYVQDFNISDFLIVLGVYFVINFTICYLRSYRLRKLRICRLVIEALLLPFKMIYRPVFCLARKQIMMM